MTKRRREPHLPPDFVGATDARMAHGDVVLEGFVEDGCRGLRKRHRVDRLHRYLRHGTISREQYAAGRRFTEDAEAAQVGIQSLLDPSRTGGGDGPEARMVTVGERVVAAQRSFRSAVAAMGIVNSQAVIAVCLTNTAADQWAMAARFPQNDGASALRAGLQSLAIHYGLDK